MEARAHEIQGSTVYLMDAIAALAEGHVGHVVVTGSHGGLSSARVALQHPPLLAVFNDAGVGKDAAGKAGLVLLGDLGIAAATVSASSARIGDAEDTLEHGRISYVNDPAAHLGCVTGQSVKDAIAAVLAATVR